MYDKIMARFFEYTYKKKCKDIELTTVLNGDRSYISHLKNSKKKLTLQKLILLSFHFTELDLNWLIRGKSLKKAKQTTNYSLNVGAPDKVNDITATELENSHLKELIKEKEEQIKLLKQLLNR
jgi:hypothetical protein